MCMTIKSKIHKNLFCLFFSLNNTKLNDVSFVKSFGHFLHNGISDDADNTRHLYAQGNNFIRKFYMRSREVKQTTFRKY